MSSEGTQEIPVESDAPPTEATSDVERDGTAPLQQTSGEREFINLPSVISDEFGISRSQARMELVSGEVFVDGEKVPNNEDIERESVAGKTIEVKGGNTRTFRFQIDATP